MTATTEIAYSTQAENFLSDLTRRPRRNRKSPAIRDLTAETVLLPQDLVLPLFVCEGENRQESIASLPGISRQSADVALKTAHAALSAGVRSVILFPYIPKEKRDAEGSEARNPDNLANRTIRWFKQELPDLCVMVDVALDPYTSHGHDGLVNSEGMILNDPTVRALGQMALCQAEAGVDVIAPSDMMDGRIGYLRKLLDAEGYSSVSLMAYAAKYASAFYGPFRDALDSAPTFGDKRSYQMNPANVQEALLECHLDEQEGADLLLIKPGLPYLDVLSRVAREAHLPVGAYQVSGEYAMIHAAGQNGWVDSQRIMVESLLSLKRAGARFILTYAALDVAKQLCEELTGAYRG